MPVSPVFYLPTSATLCLLSASADDTSGCVFTVFECVSFPPQLLLLSQVDRSGLSSDGNPVFVQRFNQNLPHVFVVGVKVKDISHHVGQTLIWEFL